MKSSADCSVYGKGNRSRTFSQCLWLLRFCARWGASVRRKRRTVICRGLKIVIIGGKRAQVVLEEDGGAAMSSEVGVGPLAVGDSSDVSGPGANICFCICGDRGHEDLRAMVQRLSGTWVNQLSNGTSTRCS